MKLRMIYFFISTFLSSFVCHAEQQLVEKSRNKQSRIKKLHMTCKRVPTKISTLCKVLMGYLVPSEDHQQRTNTLQANKDNGNNNPADANAPSNSNKAIRAYYKLTHRI